jgi:SAM-dependent methyltransferase
MPAETEVRTFYEAAYATPGEDGLRYARWRALGAVGKADHVERLLGQAGLQPARIADIGCGDGALIRELQARGIGVEHTGFEISQAALAIARDSTPKASFEHYDGAVLPAAAGAFDLGILSHVLEHVHHPADLLAEAARACGALVVEVPLEANASARRAGKREGSDEIGHVQRFARADVAAVAAQAGLRVLGEVSDPLPLSVHVFFARGTTGRARAMVKHAARTTLHSLSERAAQRVFTVHYACLLAGEDRSGPAGG